MQFCHPFLLSLLSVRMQFCPSFLHPPAPNLPATELFQSQGVCLLGLPLPSRWAWLCRPTELLAGGVCTPALRKATLLHGLFDFTPYWPFSAISTHTFSLLLFPFSAQSPQKYTIWFYSVFSTDSNFVAHVTEFGIFTTLSCTIYILYS